MLAARDPWPQAFKLLTEARAWPPQHKQAVKHHLEMAVWCNATDVLRVLLAAPRRRSWALEWRSELWKNAVAKQSLAAARLLVEFGVRPFGSEAQMFCNENGV